MALCDVTSNSVHNLKFSVKSTDRYGLTQFNWELYERTLVGLEDKTNKPSSRELCSGGRMTVPFIFVYKHKTYILP